MDWTNADYGAAAGELVRALRGPRSQRALSRRLGFSTNVLYTWEAGRTHPTGAGFLALVEQVGLDPRAALRAFYRLPPRWLSEGAPSLPLAETVARFLRDLAGDRPTVELARAAGKSRFAMARLLSGETEPRLPDLLRVVQASTLRLLDFVAAFADPARLPTLAGPWERLEASRRLAYEEPMSHAVLRVIELSAYRALPEHRPGFIAEHLGITAEAEARYLGLLEQSGQVELRECRYVPTEVGSVDTRRDPERAAQLRRFWTETALERFGQRDDDVFAFSLGTVSRRDLERVREVHRRYFEELRAIIGSSQPAESLLLANVQLIRLA